MPVRSLTSSVIRWPDAETVTDAVRRWAREAAEEQKGVVRIGYFGSYATGDWGVGSDVDFIGGKSEQPVTHMPPDPIRLETGFMKFFHHIKGGFFHLIIQVGF